MDPVDYLRTPAAIRQRCGRLFDLGCQGRLAHFEVDLGRLGDVADYVLRVMRDHYPDLNIPFHSRWRHFEAGESLSDLEQVWAGWEPLAKARSQCDLAVVSVLLDAGAGPDWCYCESDRIYRRSEGLAVASLRAFGRGVFSSDAADPYRVDAVALGRLSEADLAGVFQVSSANPLVGLAGRVALLQRLGAVLHSQPTYFGATEIPRPGNLVDYLAAQDAAMRIPAAGVLKAVLRGLGEIWPGRVSLVGTNLGDVWPHPALAGDPLVGSDLVPFHKLSQWLTYSLLEPLQQLGIQIGDLDDLTGLPEYRNGGLCLDLGLLRVKDRGALGQPHAVGSALVVEWRALTVCLLDQIAAAIREQLQLSPEQLPLARVLQGGTWMAGRRIAAQLRTNGIPPLMVESDGTVF